MLLPSLLSLSRRTGVLRQMAIRRVSFEVPLLPEALIFLVTRSVSEEKMMLASPRSRVGLPDKRSLKTYASGY
ncbi:hypothetical protein Pan14r_05330 [Crateriforma conspicua]|uniref:Uncharacterized protein n=1 Tax=Crateriforma conspicua TaxID=2527996 RepID=A0A5C5Y0C4_9PLAN|nr:hypothetical protein Pan14r_05330 [Crateriforma conspicua]